MLGSREYIIIYFIKPKDDNSSRRTRCTDAKQTRNRRVIMFNESGVGPHEVAFVCS
jgi:hypothetical protein